MRYLGHGTRQDGLAYIRRYQRELSLFFRAWDNGNLVKARIGEKWLIVHRHTGTAGVSQVASAPVDRPPIHCKIDLTAIGRGPARLKVLP